MWINWTNCIHATNIWMTLYFGFLRKLISPRFFLFANGWCKKNKRNKILKILHLEILHMAYCWFTMTLLTILPFAGAWTISITNGKDCVLLHRWLHSWILYFDCQIHECSELWKSMHNEYNVISGELSMSHQIWPPHVEFLLI